VLSAIPSTLSDVIAAVIANLVGIGEVDYPHVDGSGLVGIYIGERYLRQEGAPPRIVFVRADAESNGGISVGARQVGGISESVDCYVWGAEGSTDLDRLRDAETRWHRLLNAFKACAPGRLKAKRRPRLRGTNIETYGEEFVWAVEYTYAVPYDQTVWDYAYAHAASPAPSPPNPDQPDGDTGAVFAPGTITLTNTRT
jgi:hypothetical protein